MGSAPDAPSAARLELASFTGQASALTRTPPAQIVRNAQRSYELSMTATEVVDHLCRTSGLRVLGPEEATRMEAAESLVVIDEAGFTIYKPWGGRIITVERVSSDELAIGPAVVGRCTPTPQGSRLQISVKWYHPVPSQRRTLGIASAVTLVVALVMLLATAAHPIILGIVGVSLAGLLGSVLFYGRHRRVQDVCDLLAIVERTFGPLELPAAGGNPHRRDDAPSG